MANTRIIMQALPGIPMIMPGDSLPAIITAGLSTADITLQDGDILVISSKIVSKAENRFVNLETITPSDTAYDLAEKTGKEARLVELILQNSTALSRYRFGVLVVRHILGFTSANAGIDVSNFQHTDEERVLLLPEDPDRSAAEIRDALRAEHNVAPGIIISDTHGRPFREGNIGFAIGSAGVPVLVDGRGETDLFGNVLRATITPLADELAAAAGLISGQAAEGQPVVLIRGVNWEQSPQTAKDLVRSPESDLFS